MLINALVYHHQVMNHIGLTNVLGRFCGKGIYVLRMKLAISVGGVTVLGSTIAGQGVLVRCSIIGLFERRAVTGIRFLASGAGRWYRVLCCGSGSIYLIGRRKHPLFPYII